MLTMNEPVTWKNQLSLQSLFLTPLFPFIVLPEFPLDYGAGMKWPSHKWPVVWPWHLMYLLRLWPPRLVLGIRNWTICYQCLLFYWYLIYWDTTTLFLSVKSLKHSPIFVYVFIHKLYASTFVLMYFL
jgi:hypothetical protein